MKYQKWKEDDILLCASLAQVDHRLPQLLLADAPVVVAVEHPERGLDVVHLVAAVLQDLLPHAQEVRPVHHPVPVAVSLHISVRRRGHNLKIPGQRATLGRHEVTQSCKMIYVKSGNMRKI